MRRVFLLMLLSSCATVADSPQQDRTRLANELQGRLAGPPQACVSAGPGRSLTIASEDTLILRDGRTIWLNRLRHPCLGMRPDRQIAVEPALGSHYCRGDRVQAVDLTTAYSGQFCPLRDFVPYRRP